ncbi:RHS repeat-associated core domain-containing protein [Cellulosimicrobium cellulans]|uniref:RHS repeat-associated core domain-containing protein n=1 Tax=Cellulosimicrobium cellulans TaxID=1710 RepID=UPI0024061383|nr:RHS repeat-associated core domain-containing protein [Cellulosimicrobium cellulans]
MATLVPGASAAPGGVLSAARVVELARQAADASRGPGTSPEEPDAASVAQAPSTPTAPVAAPVEGAGHVVVEDGGRVEAGPVSVAFSGHGLAADVEVEVGDVPLPRSARTAGGVAGLGEGLPEDGALVGSPFEVAATTAAGKQVTRFPTAFDVVEHAVGPGTVENVVSGVALEVEVDPGAVEGLDPGSVRLFTRESAEDTWVEVPSYLDIEHWVVRGELDHLSQFVVIGTPFVADPGPRVVLDPDNDVAETTAPGGKVTELGFNVRLANEVAARLANQCLADVLVTRVVPEPAVVSQELRSGMAAAWNPDLTLTLAFDALRGHPWGVESDGGSNVFSRAGDEPLGDLLAAQLPAYTGRPAVAHGQGRLPYDDFRGLPGGLAHVEALYLDHNFDWPVIENGMGAIADGVFTGAGMWLEGQGRGFDCTDPATGGWPARPSQAELDRWRHLGHQNYQAYGADPVAMSTGNLVEDFPLATLPGLGEQVIDLGLVYNSQDGRETRTGFGWSFSLGARAQRFDDGSVLVARADGASFVFTPNGAGGYAGEPGTGSLGEAGGGKLEWTDPDRGRWVFDAGDIEGIGELVAYTNPAGQTLTLTYATPDGDDAFTPLTSVTDAAGQQITFTADSRGRVSGFALPDGRIWSLGYDAAGDLTTITDPVSGTRVFTYDAAHRMLTATDPLGATYLVNEYDATGRVLKQLDAEQNVRTFAYTDTPDSDGLRTTLYTDNEGGKHTYWYDDAYRIVRTEDPEGGTQQLAYDAAGNVTSFTDEDDRISAYTYDEAGNLVSETAPNGEVIEYAYDPSTNLTRVIEPGADSDSARVTGYETTPQGLVGKVVDAAGGVTVQEHTTTGDVARVTTPAGSTVAYAYDTRGNLTSVTDPLGRVTTMAYDASNRLTASTDPAGNTTTYAWDVLDRLIAQTDPTGATTAFAYDGNGNLTGSTAPDGGVTTYAWDGLFHLTSVTDPLGNVTAYGYDGEDNLVSVTDPAGNITRYDVDRAGRVVATTEPTGAVTAYTYDGAGNLLTETDPAGGVTTYTHDEVGRVVGVTDPTGATWGTGYDPAGRVVAEVDPLGNTTTYVWDDLDRLVSVTDPAGAVSAYAYDADGNLTRVTDRRGHTITYTYDPAAQLTGIEGADGSTETFTYDPAGDLVESVDPLDAATTYTYDAAGRLTATIDPLGHTTTVAYDPVGRPVTMTDPTGAVTAVEYDLAGQVLAEVDPTGARTAYAYDPVGNLTQATAPTGTVTAYGYDPVGRLTQVIEGFDQGKPPTPDTNVLTAYTYDEVGNLVTVTDPRGKTTTRTHDKVGNVLTETDPTGATWKHTYDQAGRPDTTTDALGQKTTYGYDPRGDLTGVSYTGGATASFTYDAEQNLIAMVDPSGATGWAYDEAGRVTSQLDTAGRTLDYTYDFAGQLLTTTLTGGGIEKTTTAFTYDAAGRATAQHTPFGDVAYAYDPADRMTAVRRTNPDGTAAVESTFAYDLAGRPLTVAHLTPDRDPDPDPVVAASVIEPAAQPDGPAPQCTASGSTEGVTAYLANREPADPVDCLKTGAYLTGRTLPPIAPVAAGGDGVRFDNTYNPTTGQLQATTRTLGPVNPATDPAAADIPAPLDPAKTAARSVVTAGPNFSPVTTPTTETRDYTFDRLSRLTATSSSAGTESTYAYDPAGNRTSWSTTDNLDTLTPGDPLETITVFDDANRAESAAVTAAGGTANVTYTHDANGARTRTQVTGNDGLQAAWGSEAAYDPTGRLAAIETEGSVESYAYDGLGRRTGTTVDDGTLETSTATTWDGLAPVASTTTGRTEATDQQVLIRDTLGQALIQHTTALSSTPDGETRWQLLDQLGSTVAEATSTDITQLASWSNYGTPGLDTTGWAAELGYTGQPTDFSTGATSFYARTYDPTTATWTTADTWRGDLTAPQTQNRHAYVLGNPVEHTDHLGYAPRMLLEGKVGYNKPKPATRAVGGYPPGYRPGNYTPGFRPAPKPAPPFRTQFHKPHTQSPGPWRSGYVTPKQPAPSIKATTPRAHSSTSARHNPLAWLRNPGRAIADWANNNPVQAYNWSLTYFDITTPIVSETARKYLTYQTRGYLTPQDITDLGNSIVLTAWAAIPGAGLASGTARVGATAFRVGTGASRTTAGTFAAPASKLPWTSWAQYAKTTIGGKAYAVIGNRYYTRHAVDRMQPSGFGSPVGTSGPGRSIAPTFVDDVIRSGSSSRVYVDGTERTIHRLGSVEVITEGRGLVVISINPFK